jgi:cystathionine beta-lyase/cystathionine gamma-synthase
METSDGRARVETVLSQAGSRWDALTGAVAMPIYQTATFRHPALGQSTGFDYSRTTNPTRQALEQTIAALEGGPRGFAFASGLAAIDAALHLVGSGTRLAVTEDLYGGTFRLLERVYRGRGIAVDYVDTSRVENVERALAAGARAVFVESLTNPLLKAADLRAIAAAARAHGALLIVDSTFLTPYLQQPLALGADVVVHSASKYLGGHNDVVAGLVVARTAELAERLAFYQNAVGGVLGPQDSWLLLRGLKTLAVRLDRQQTNAQAIAEWLARHPRVRRVYYPGLPGDPGHAVLAAQSRGFGGMVSFEIDDAQRVPGILECVRVFLFAESLGGVESLITYPIVQTHADIDVATRERLGINDRLLRLSVGLEHVDDLLGDLESALGEGGR